MPPIIVTKRDYLAAGIIGEAVAWLAVLTLEGAEVSLPFIRLAKGVLPILFPFLSLLGLFIVGIVSKKIPVLLQIAKFFLVGSFNTFINLGILNLLIIIFQKDTGSSYTIFKGVSFIAAVTNSYFWNKFWVFKKAENQVIGQETSQTKEFLQFFVVSVVALAIDVGVASFFVNLVGPLGSIGTRPWATISAILGTLVALVWNFLGYKFVVFKR